jgi:hypothetical protein
MTTLMALPAVPQATKVVPAQQHPRLLCRQQVLHQHYRQQRQAAAQAAAAAAVLSAQRSRPLHCLQTSFSG